MQLLLPSIPHRAFWQAREDHFRRQKTMSLNMLVIPVLLTLMTGATAQAQGTVNGQFQTSQSGSTLTVVVQLQANPGDQGLGTSTLQFTYDNTALTYVSGAYDNYNSTQTTYSGGSAGYNSTITLPDVNKVSMNIELGFTSDGNGQALPNAFTDVATFQFTINDQSATANLSWDTIDLFNGPGQRYTTGTFTGSNETLPVELVSFTAVLAGVDAQLSWATASETNNAGFEIERADGVGGAFETIGFVEGSGTTLEARQYHFADTALPFEAARVRYRLRQLDYDGAFEYSPVVALEAGVPERVQLHGNFPNPFNPETVIRYELPVSGLVQIHVYDALGRQIMTLVDGSLQAGRHEVRFNAHDLPSGIYFYRMQAGNFHEVRRMLLVK